TAKGGVWSTTFDRCGQKTTESVEIRDWGDTEWQLFEQECHIMATFWDFLFYLTPPPTFVGLDVVNEQWGVRPHVECRFMPVFVEPGQGPHVRYEVARVTAEADKKLRETGQKAKFTSGTSRDVNVAGLLSSQTN